MNERLIGLRSFIGQKKHHIFRRFESTNWGDEFSTHGYTPLERATIRFERLLKMEQPVILEGEKIVYTRSVNNKSQTSIHSSQIQETISPLFSQDEWRSITESHFVHYTGDVNNICPNYELLLNRGTAAIKKELKSKREIFENEKNVEAVTYLNSLIRVLHAIEDLANRYRNHAESLGYREVAEVLTQVPFKQPRTFHEALQFLRIINFTLYLSSNHHSSLGRFDQYMFPYLVKDLRYGVINRMHAIELVEEFFISLNKDTDLYYGMQIGDNGQTITLGGKNEFGDDTCNLLTDICLEASLNIMMIDPKLNLRVHQSTSQDILVTASKLTKAGLGFPQYSNDEIVIPGLIEHGYDQEDAYNYAIAACWEYIIPGKGMDIVDIDAINLPLMVDRCIRQYATEPVSYDVLFDRLRFELNEDFEKIKKRVSNLFVVPAPFLSILMDGCIEDARDISKGNFYNNYGVIATGISTAADSLTAIKNAVFDCKKVTMKQMIAAIDADFAGYEVLQSYLKNNVHKFGNDNQEADKIACDLLEAFADVMAGVHNERGGIYRPGTGTAMYYIWHPKELGASPDGRKKGEPFAANFSPSLNINLKGPISVLRSFSKPNMKKLINGGPVTIELHDASIDVDNGIEKLANLIRFFIHVRCQQMQLNTVNAERIRDAMIHPELHQNLIVRVWGWSGYFVQLDRDYQEQILQRCEFAL